MQPSKTAVEKQETYNDDNYITKRLTRHFRYVRKIEIIKLNVCRQNSGSSSHSRKGNINKHSISDDGKIIRKQSTDRDM
jgi:hypothetical protein